MTKGRSRQTKTNIGKHVEEAEERPKLTATTCPAEPGLAAALAASKLTGEQPLETMADLQTVLQEIKDFRRENAESFKELKEDIKNTNIRVEEAERRIMESEGRIQMIEDATLELLELQKQTLSRLTDQESRSRRDNIRIHGVKEGAEEGSQSMIDFIVTLLKEKLDLAPSLDLIVERAHRALAARPPNEAPPRSIVVKLQSYRTKEAIITAAWQKKGFMYEGRKIIIDHDYAPEILKQRKLYTEAKRVLRERKIRFQTPFPAKLRVFYDGETQMYNTAAEATKDMATRGYQVSVVPPEEDRFEKMSRIWSRAEGRGRQADARPGYMQKLDVYRRSVME
ncbi:unnamed protein product [Knipowitschia caucasica]